MTAPDRATLLELAKVWRATADSPAELQDLITFAGGSEPPDVLRALARLSEIAAGQYDDNDPDWLRLCEINAARSVPSSPEETP